VLPFENLSGDSAQEYFTDGIHEALIGDLSRVSDLKVISRTSVLRYRESTQPIQQIARELDVDAVIEGSVLWAGDSARIQASLIDATAGNALATVTYVRDMQNVLGLVRDVSRGIAGELAAATTKRNEETKPVPLVDPQAYETYLRARYLMHDFQGDSWREAIRLYRQAIALDSTFSLAYSSLAQTYFLLGYFGLRARSEVWAGAREMALRALELDEGASEAYSVLGYLELYQDWDWNGAETALLEALRLDPNDALARHGYADLLTIEGRGEEGLRQVQLAREIDPFSPLVNGPVVGHLYITRRFEDALAELARLRALFERPDYGQEFVVFSLWQLGRYDEALNEFRALWSHDPGMIRAVEEGYAAAGPQGAMRAAADHAADRWDPEGGDAYRIARFYARAGDVDLSLEWLERAYQARKPQFLHAVADPVFDPLRSDPRFIALLRRIGLPPRSLTISAR
jgi:TolB-like protein/tetratricopeptide (TPR) repeat protein